MDAEEISSKINKKNLKIEMIDSQVNTRIKHLEEELANAQADKEFVWSLWRQLQVSNPVLTDAISCVIQREKEKTEIRDRKILEIIRTKDAKITDLTESIQQKDTEYKKFSEKIKDIEIELIKKIEETKFLELNAKTFSDKEQMYEQMLRSNEDKYERSLKENDKEKQHLICKIRDLVKEVAETTERESNFKLEIEQQNNTIELLNTQIKQANKNYEKLMSELNEFRTVIGNNLKSENEKLTNELHSKTAINEKLHNELNELCKKLNENADYTNQQEKLVRQLKENQKNLHFTMKKQQDAFESENNSLKKMYEQMNQKYEQVLQSEKQIISETFSNHQQFQQQQALHLQQIKLAEKSNNETIKAFQYEIDQLKLKISLQSQQLNDKQLICDELKQKLVFFESIQSEENASKLTKGKDSITNNSKTLKSKQIGRFKAVTQFKSRPKALKATIRFTKSNYIKTSPRPDRSEIEITQIESGDDCSLKNDLASVNKLKKFYDNLCQAKDAKLEIIRTANQRRIECLTSIEKEYKILKDYLKSYVDEDSIEKLLKANNATSQIFLNDSDNINNQFKNIGYVRKDSENVLNELKLSRYDNRSLVQENLDLKQKIDSLNIEYHDLNEKYHNLNLESKIKLEEKVSFFNSNIAELDKNLKESNSKNIFNEREIVKLKEKINELDDKRRELLDERFKYTELSAKLSDENKKLHKKWFQIKKNETKFQSLLIDQMNKRSRQNEKIRSKVYKNYANQNAINKAKTNQVDFAILKLDSFSSLSLSSDEENMPKMNIKNDKKKRADKKITPNKLLRQKNSTLLRKKLDLLHNQNLMLANQLDHLNSENLKLNKEIDNIDSKLKKAKNQNENYVSEINILKKKESEHQDKEENLKKQVDQIKDEIKKAHDSKMKQVSSELTKQITVARGLRSENEKLGDKLKVSEEKLNHTERDNIQKKQLIEFYKKKLSEFNKKENDLVSNKESENEIIDDLKLQIKKLNESIEKSKIEIKSLKEQLKVIQSEKIAFENKSEENEKALTQLNLKYESLKKEKVKSDANLKISKRKANEIEAYLHELENSAESNLKSLSETSQETIALVQNRLKYAFKSIEDYEKIFKYLYESLINRCIALRKEKKQIPDSNKKTSKKQVSKNKGVDSSIDENMKKAIDLASNVLNLTSNELEDILLTSNSLDNDETINYSCTNKLIDLEDDLVYKKKCQKLLYEFNRLFNASNKELLEKNNLNDDFYKKICDLILQRLNDVLYYEKELANIN